MDVNAIFFLIVTLLAAASVGGIVTSIVKLHRIKKGAQGSRAPWIVLLVVCGIYILFIIAAIIFLFMIMVSIAVNGM